MDENFEMIRANKNLELEVNKLLECNRYLEEYNLHLTKDDVIVILSDRKETIKTNGRIEFGKWVIEEIIKEFCDSPYLSGDGIVEVLNELLNIFYHYKNETKDLVTDEELIKFMKKYFDGDAHGDLEILRDVYMEKMRKNVLLRKSMESGFDEWKFRKNN